MCVSKKCWTTVNQCRNILKITRFITPDQPKRLKECHPEVSVQQPLTHGFLCRPIPGSWWKYDYAGKRKPLARSDNCLSQTRRFLPRFHRWTRGHSCQSKHSICRGNRF